MKHVTHPELLAEVRALLAPVRKAGYPLGTDQRIALAGVLLDLAREVREAPADAWQHTATRFDKRGPDNDAPCLIEGYEPAGPWVPYQTSEYDGYDYYEWRRPLRRTT